MKLLAAALVALLVLAFVAHEQQVKTPAVVVCGEVHGGGTITARGVDWAEDFASTRLNTSHRNCHVLSYDEDRTPALAGTSRGRGPSGKDGQHERT